MIYKDLCVGTHKYKDPQGNDRKKWITVGAVCYEDDGTFRWMKMFKWFNPAGVEGECYLKIFEHTQKESAVQSSNANSNKLYSDVPF